VVYRQHIRNHEGRHRQGKHPCPHCSHVAMCELRLKQHIDSKHLKQRNLSCYGSCGYTTGFMSALSLHHKNCRVFSEFIQNVWNANVNAYQCPNAWCSYEHFCKLKFLCHFGKCKSPDLLWYTFMCIKKLYFIRMSYWQRTLKYFLK
jgi:hypothetical protein